MMTSTCPETIPHDQPLASQRSARQGRDAARVGRSGGASPRHAGGEPARRVAFAVCMMMAVLAWAGPHAARAQLEHEPAAHAHEDEDHAEHAHGDHAEAEDHGDHAGHAAHAEHAAPAEPAGHADPDDHDDPAGHDDHGDAADAGLALTAEQRTRFGIVVRTAGPGRLEHEARLPGEIVFNDDRVVHVVPRVSGIAREVHKSVGDRVHEGEVLAVIDSRELADARSEYMAAQARAQLAAVRHAREEELFTQKVSSEQDYLEAQQALAEARIARRAVEQKLRALGLNQADIDALDPDHDDALTPFAIRAPLNGVVTARHLALGESVEADADIFTVADVGSVWAHFAVHAKHLGVVRAGQAIVVESVHSGDDVRARVAMVTPFADVATRAATARVVLDNADGRWVPGTFVTGYTRLAEEDLDVVLPRDAVQHLDGEDVVFVEHEGRFEATPVTTGRADRTRVEVIGGLAPGTAYVAEGAFHLKATLLTSNLDPHAGHGH